MPDQYRLAPYGDAVIVNTPTLDNVAKQLYAQQQQRQARQQQENQALDQMLQKDYGRIRSVDTPDVVNGYSKVKAIRKQLLFDKDLQKDPLAYNKKQQELNDAMIGLRGTINGSAEIKEANKAINAEQLKDPMAFSDDYGNMMATQMNTPLNQLRNHPVYGDLTNQDTYRYVGPNYDFNDDLSKIYDKKNKVIGKEEALDKQGIQFRSPVFEYGTPPAQVFDGLVSSITHEKERAAAKRWKELTPEVVQKIEQDYKAIPLSKWEQMGVTGPQDIQLRGGSDAEKYMRMLAMQNAVNTNPRLVNYENRTSEKAKMDLQFDRQKQMEAIEHSDAKALAEFKKKIDPNDTELNNVWYQSYLDNIISNAKGGGERHHIYNPSNGKSELYYNMVKPDPFLLKSMSIGNATPDRVGVTESGELIPIFLKYDSKGNVIKTKGGVPVLDENYSQPMSYDQALVNLGYRGSTKKQLKEDQGKIRSSKPVGANNKIEDLRKKYDY